MQENNGSKEKMKEFLTTINKELLKEDKSESSRSHSAGSTEKRDKELELELDKKKKEEA